MTERFPLTLGIDENDLVSCVSCGLCLPHCPTYRVTQEESASPRGRIALMREVTRTGTADDAFVGFMDACIQCRGCETACPAGVPFGRMMETTRAALADQAGTQPWWRRLGYRVLGMPRTLAAGSRLLALAQRIRLVPRRLGLPRIPLRQDRLEPSGEDVWLFTGCVMDAWMRDTHAAAQRLVEATGAGVALAPGAGCCGALHVHAGLVDEARALAERVMTALPGDAPILVDSAGCGAQLKDYGHLLGTADAERFAARVQDIGEWLAAHVDRLPDAPADGPRPRLAVQDPCHLRHVQRAEQPTRTVLGRYAEVVELDDEGLCCGAGGAYSTLHPETAADVRDRKLASIARSDATLVASANPGCMLHLQNAGVDAEHPVTIIDRILRADERNT